MEELKVVNYQNEPVLRIFDSEGALIAIAEKNGSEIRMESDAPFAKEEVKAAIDNFLSK